MISGGQGYEIMPQRLFVHALCIHEPTVDPERAPAANEQEEANNGDETTETRAGAGIPLSRFAREVPPVPSTGIDGFR